MLGLGADLGTRACGLTLVRYDRVHWHFVEALTARPSARLDFVARLKVIEDTAQSLLKGRALDWIGIEDPIYVIAGKQRSHETNFEALRLLAVLGLACGWGFERSVPVVLVDTAEVKRAVGAASSASKDDVRRGVRFCVRDCPPELDEHRADAAAAAVASGRRILVDGAIRAARESRLP